MGDTDAGYIDDDYLNSVDIALLQDQLKQQGIEISTPDSEKGEPVSSSEKDKFSAAIEFFNLTPKAYKKAVLFNISGGFYSQILNTLGFTGEASIEYSDPE